MYPRNLEHWSRLNERNREREKERGILYRKRKSERERDGKIDKKRQIDRYLIQLTVKL